MSRAPRLTGVLRVDDLQDGWALEFASAARPPRRVVVAHHLDDVVPALEQVQAAVAAGSWAVGLLAYEAAPALDAALVTRPPDPGLPLVWFALTEPPRRVPVIQPAPWSAGPWSAAPWRAGPWAPDTTEAQHAAAVAGVRERIARGETYQVNLTLRLSAPFTGDAADPAGLYADLAHAQRGSHCALLDLGASGGGVVVASASPEAFVEVRTDGHGRRAVTRPMKGTAPRGRSAAEDALARERLAGSPKERAENVMIVDLLRNDLQRVCSPGSVEVTELLAAQAYPTVHQVVSTVEGRLRAGTTTVDLLRALFPCGSVTGAPKASTMRAVAELERSPRGAYCGALGWLAPPGEPVQARFSVAIRTAVVSPTADGQQVSYGTGSGVTWDSRPGAEHRELLSKARVLAPAVRRREPFGLLETLACFPGPVGLRDVGLRDVGLRDVGLRDVGLRDVERHLARLAASAAFCGIPCDVAAARAALVAAVEAVVGAGDGVALRVRLELGPDGGLAVTTAPLEPPVSPRPVSPQGQRRVRLVLDPEPRASSSDWWPRHKTTRRGWIDDLRAQHGVGPPSGSGPDEVAWTNERGEVCEASTASLAVRLDGRWWTPPVECGLLPGVLRGRLVESGQLDLRVLRPDDLRRAEALAVVSSLRGWRPAVLL